MRFSHFDGREPLSERQSWFALHFGQVLQRCWEWRRVQRSSTWPSTAQSGSIYQHLQGIWISTLRRLFSIPCDSLQISWLKFCLFIGSFFFFFILKIFFYSKKEIFIKEEICYLGFWLNTWISNWYKIWNRPWRKQVKRRRLVSSCTWRWPSSDYRLIWTRSSAVWIRWNRSGRRTATLQLRRTARWSRSARSRQCTTRCLVYPTRRRRGSPSETWTGRPLPLSSAGPSWRSTSWPDCVIDELSDRRRTLPIKRHCFFLFFFYSF